MDETAVYDMFKLSQCLSLDDLDDMLRRLCDLLLSGVYSMEQCGALCGYSDPAYFSRMFRKAMGQSPSQFLKSHKEERPGDA